MKTPSIRCKTLANGMREAVDNTLRSLHFIGLMMGLCLFTHERESSGR